MRPLNGSILPMSNILPAAARDILVAASRVDSRIDYGESEHRAERVDSAIDFVRLQHPEYFQGVK